MTWIHPEYLWLIPILCVGLWGVWVTSDRRFMKRKRHFLGLKTGDVCVAGGTRRLGWRRILICLALAGIIVGLARPQYGVYWKEAPVKGVDVIIALDLSRSMLAEDFRPNRLERAKLAIEDFIGELAGDRVGLIGFAGEAFLQCPLTLDQGAVLQTLRSLHVGLLERGGTDLSAAIRLGMELYRSSPGERVMVLISDGEDLGEAGIAAAADASSMGLRIFTVGVGSEGGELIPYEDNRGQRAYVRDRSGQYVKSQLDVDTLEAIAETTGGFYVPLGGTGDGLEQVYAAGIEPIQAGELGEARRKHAYEAFQWPVAFALLCYVLQAILVERRRSS